MPRSFVRAALLALSCSLAPAFAQTATQPASTVPPATAATDKPFSLDEAIALALRKNFDLQIQANSVLSARDIVTIQEAGFDPTITANVTRSLNQQASTTSRLDGTATTGPRSDTTTARPVGGAGRTTPPTPGPARP